jgi:glycosyltransferase involved in cell wall biosynthesis
LRYRLAIIASHPVQYHSPWYRKLATYVDLHVFYAHRASAEDQANAGFGVPFEWDIDLLGGYAYSWLPNRARRPGAERFFGCDTPSIRTELGAQRFDAVLVNGWNLLCFWQAVWAARCCHLPLMVRGDSHLLTPRSRLRRAIKRLGYPRLLSAFDAFLSVGCRNTEYLTAYGVSPERIFRVPHCVDNEFFRLSLASKGSNISALRHQYDIPDGATVFLFVGKFLVRKRPLDVLKALDRLKQGYPHVWGLFIGAGPLEKDLRAHAAAHATPCSFGGFLNQRQIGAAYALSDILVLPGQETWGLVANEAMACGTPAIVSDAAGCAPDLIIEGETGLTYHEGDAEQLAECMRRVVGDPPLLGYMARHAEAHISRFSLEAACEGVVRALQFVLTGKEQAC